MNCLLLLSTSALFTVDTIKILTYVIRLCFQVKRSATKRSMHVLEATKIF